MSNMSCLLGFKKLNWRFLVQTGTAGRKVGGMAFTVSTIMGSAPGVQTDCRIAPMRLCLGSRAEGQNQKLKR
jgi:hypothetical protein